MHDRKERKKEEEEEEEEEESKIFTFDFLDCEKG